MTCECHHLAGASHFERSPGQLIQEVGVDAVRSHEADSVFKSNAFGLKLDIAGV